MNKENNIRYKGKGEHSVRELEAIIEQQAEELHQLKVNDLSNELRAYIEAMHTQEECIGFIDGYERAKRID